MDQVTLAKIRYAPTDGACLFRHVSKADRLLLAGVKKTMLTSKPIITGFAS